MRIAKCPGCSDLITEVRIEEVEASGTERPRKCMLFLCAECGALLGVCPHPDDIVSDVVAEVVLRLRSDPSSDVPPITEVVVERESKA